MPKNNAQRVLDNPDATREEIEAAIDWLQGDINYVYRAHAPLSPEMRQSIEEARSLLLQLRNKLNSQSK